MANPRILMSSTAGSLRGNRLSLDFVGFSVCLCILIASLFCWCCSAYSFSQESNTNFLLFKNKLERGFFGRLMDNSDDQYSVSNISYKVLSKSFVFIRWSRSCKLPFVLYNTYCLQEDYVY
jgi:hypothetical protein